MLKLIAKFTMPSVLFLVQAEVFFKMQGASGLLLSTQGVHAKKQQRVTPVSTTRHRG